MYQRGAAVALTVGLAAFGLVGCSRREAVTAPPEGSYGPMTTLPSTNIARPRLPGAPADDRWRDEAMWILQTELSPLTVVHSKSNYMGFFAGLSGGAPSHAAYAAAGGQRVAKAGTPMDAAAMSESWVVVWFAGSAGWTNWDSPWAVFLEHKPARMWLDEVGLQFQFNGPAGTAAIMPLYGYEKLPLPGHEKHYARSREALERRAKTYRTADWPKALPQEPLMRVRYWAGLARCIPVYCEDTFSVDRGRDSVTIRQRFDWLTIQDDWGTRALKVAPVSPVLGLALLDKVLPVRFSREPADFDYVTPSGPFFGLEGVDTYDVTVPLLKYINEAEVTGSPTNSHPSVRAAQERLEAVARDKYSKPGALAITRDDGTSTYPGIWQFLENSWDARALSHLDPATRDRALTELERHMRDDVLGLNNFLKENNSPSEFSGKTVGWWEPGNGEWNRVTMVADGLSHLGYWRGRFLADLACPLADYATASGNWSLVRSNWGLIRSNFFAVTANYGSRRWRGPDAVPFDELSDRAAPFMAMARMAYRVGDVDTYNYASQLFVRNLLEIHARQRGIEYFRGNQPWHSAAAFPQEVYLASPDRGDGDRGWSVDGPGYPQSGNSGKYQRRWLRFNDPDVARFFRDYLSADVRGEMDRWSARLTPMERFRGVPYLQPSMIQLRSLLLNEDPAKLAAVGAPAGYSGTLSGVMATCLSVLRVSGPLRFERLIPADKPSPFVPGIERESIEPGVSPLFTVEFWDQSRVDRRAPAWPRVTWPAWLGAGVTGNFGDVRLARDAGPPRSELLPLNWNTQVRVLKPN